MHNVNTFMPEFPHSQDASPGTRRSRDHAFTLVEVVMSIGIISFAFIAIFALLPVGMTSFRKALSNSIGTQIVQRIVNEAKQTDFATLIAKPTTTRFFDDQGDEVPQTPTPTAPAPWLYLVQIDVKAPTALPGAVTGPSANLATITVKLAADPGHNLNPFTPASKVPYSIFSAFVARNQ